MGGMKRVLIISHGPFDYSNNRGRTLIELFKDYPSDKLACLCLNVGRFDFSVCKNYFQIGDKESCKSIFKRNYPVGHIVKEEEYKATHTTKKKVIRKKDRVINFFANSFGRRVKDVLYRISHFESKQLFAWLDEYKPEVIFYMPCEYIYSMKTVLKIQKKYHTSLVNFCVDDFYRYNSFGFTGLWYYWNYRNVYKKLIKNSSKLFYISPNYIDLYKDYFGVEGELLRVPSDVIDKRHVGSKEKQVVFLGNTTLGRYRSITEIAKVLYEIDDEYKVSIYTGVVRKKIKKAFEKVPNISLKRAVSYSEANDIIKNASLVINAESLKKKYFKRVWGSFSTKVPDLLMIRTPIISYGPKGQYSIDYLKDNEIWFAANNIEELKKQILIFSSHQYDEKSNNDRIDELLILNHDAKKNRQRLYDALQK